MTNRLGNNGNMRDFFLWEASKITVDGDCSHEIQRLLLPGRRAITNLDSILKSRDITLPTKVHLVKAMVSPVVMYRWDSWTVRKAECWWIDAFELLCWRRLLRIPWTARRSNYFHPKRYQSWTFIGRTDAESETPILWPPDAKIWLIGKDLNAGNDWKKEKTVTEDEMVVWHHELNGYEQTQFEKTLGDGVEQGSLGCYSPYGCKELDTTEQVNKQ